MPMMRVRVQFSTTTPTREVLDAWLKQKLGPRAESRFDAIELADGVAPFQSMDVVALAYAATSFFGAPVTFGAATDRVALPRPTLALSLRTSQPFLAQALQKKLEEIENAIGGDVTLRRVCKVLSDSLGDPKLSVDTVARLAMSRRSLQRHLSELDTSFRALLDDTRCQRASRSRATSSH